MEIIKTVNLCKKYSDGDKELYAIYNINLKIEKGEYIAITGKSGSGKSTLLNILGGIDEPSSGRVVINNEEIYKFKDKDLTRFRRKNIGFVYQFFNLIPMLTARENIVLPALFDGKVLSNKKIKEIFKTLRLSGKEDVLPNDLSGGQQQRVAIGRALINKPKILLADEPTGNLDSKTGIQIIKLLEFYNRKYKQTIVMVTHDLNLAKRADRIIEISDGKIIKDIKNDKALFKK